MQSLEKPIGILGGTYDPIHFGHLRMAIELQAAYQLDKIHIIPCFKPVHRNAPIATPEERFAMIESAIGSSDSLIADKREINRKGLSYSIDTLQELKAEKPNTPLCLIVGIDAFIGFKSWRQHEQILKLAHIIVAHRPHYDLPTTGEIAQMVKELQQTSPDYIHKNIAGGLFIQPITALEISSSSIRSHIQNNKNPQYLLPDSVYKYIMQKNIYSNDT